ncbi:MAG: glycosyltransferase family 4 protein [Pedobacter sp.]
MSIQVLHITAHLGGGVGKALSGLVQQEAGPIDVSHTIVCLEKPEKLQFVREVEATGTGVVLAPCVDRLNDLTAEADIVQVEWWGHPAVMSTLCRSPLPAMRLLVWCHISGLDAPVIPAALMQSAHQCLFTSPASMQTPEVQSLPQTARRQLAVVHSAGGIDSLPSPVRHPEEPLVAGYLGSLNFAKLHPRYADFLAQVGVPGFKVRMIGDTTNQTTLEEDCQRAGCPGVLDFRGYCTDIVTELATINVMPYILNPRHYGTTENALLEAMAMGVVPVVLNNAAESCLVQDGETGRIVATPQEFGEVLRWLYHHPQERVRLGRQASESVRNRFPATSMRKSFMSHYEGLLSQAKRHISFTDILGPDPARWFLSIQRHPDFFKNVEMDINRMDNFSLHGLFEQTKGSVFHYAACFPHDPTLSTWKKQLTELKASLNRDIRTPL